MNGQTIITLAACAITFANIGLIIGQHIRHERWRRDFTKRTGWRP